jgi:hypothetical protein
MVAARQHSSEKSLACPIPRVYSSPRMNPRSFNPGSFSFPCLWQGAGRQDALLL